MVANYACVTCSEHFTRHSSAKKHNLTQHNNNGQILPILQYMAGLSSGRYELPTEGPNAYRRRRQRGTPNFGQGPRQHHQPPPEPLMPQVRVARDSMGDTAVATATGTNNFRPGILQGQGQYPSYLQHHVDQIRSEQSPSLPPPTNQNVPTYPPMTTTNQSQSQPTNTGGIKVGISDEDIPKITELRRLLYRHPGVYSNPNMVLKNAKDFASMGNNTLLESLLTYLRKVDALQSITQQQQQQFNAGHDNFVV
jgi:hypothetical protein